MEASRNSDLGLGFQDWGFLGFRDLHLRARIYGDGLNGFVVQGEVSGISVSVRAFRMQGVGYLKFPIQAKMISRDTLLEPAAHIRQPIAKPQTRSLKPSNLNPEP